MTEFTKHKTYNEQTQKNNFWLSNAFYKVAKQIAFWSYSIDNHKVQPISTHNEHLYLRLEANTLTKRHKQPLIVAPHSYAFYLTFKRTKRVTEK